jgi:hypothetical protein
VTHVETALLRSLADEIGLTGALSRELAGVKQRRRGHDPGRVVRDLVVMLADGGLEPDGFGGRRDQDALFGQVASDATAHRMIATIASDVELIEGCVALTPARVSGSGGTRTTRPPG